MDFISHLEITLILIAGLRYSLFAYMTFLCVYPFIQELKISST